ncbi:MAG: hypothetical protein WBM90_13745 [Acidimicrobiia bacterium]
MTHRTVGAGRGVPRIWLLPLALLVLILVATFTGFLSRSLVLDLVAWWPVWVLLALLAFVARGRRVGRIKASGLVPLATTIVLGLFLVGHLQGWDVMPSSAQKLVGPVVRSDAKAALSARVDGVVQVGAGAGFLYEVDPLRRGGEVGVPEATEQTQESTVSVLLEAPSDPGFYAFAGWNIKLSSLPQWNLTIQGDIEADLSGLNITGLQVSGEGTVTLGSVSGTVPGSTSGDFIVIVPAGVPVRVVGTAQVPDTWEQLSDGARSPASGDGWVLSVANGSTLTVQDS